MMLIRGFIKDGKPGGGGGLSPIFFFFHSWKKKRKEKKVLETKTGMLMSNSIFFMLWFRSYRISCVCCPQFLIYRPITVWYSACCAGHVASNIFQSTAPISSVGSTAYCVHVSSGERRSRFCDAKSESVKDVTWRKPPGS